VILGEYDKLSGGKVFRGTSVSPPPIGRILTRVNEAFLKGLDHLADVPEILVISVSFLCEERVEAVVKIVIPLSIQAISSLSRGVDDANIVQIALCDHCDLAAQILRLALNPLPDVQQDVSGAEVKDSVNGVYSDAVQMIFGYPVKGVIGDKPSNLVALQTIEIDGTTPGGFIAIREVRRVIGKIISFGAEMVVNYVEDDG